MLLKLKDVWCLTNHLIYIKSTIITNTPSLIDRLSCSLRLESVRLIKLYVQRLVLLSFKRCTAVLHFFKNKCTGENQCSTAPQWKSAELQPCWIIKLYFLPYETKLGDHCFVLKYMCPKLLIIWKSHSYSAVSHRDFWIHQEKLKKYKLFSVRKL